MVTLDDPLPYGKVVVFDVEGDVTDTVVDDAGDAVVDDLGEGESSVGLIVASAEGQVEPSSVRLTPPTDCTAPLLPSLWIEIVSLP